MVVNETRLKAVTYSYEKARGISYGEPFESWLKDSDIESLSPEKIVKDIMNFIDENLDSENILVPSAIFTLGKKHDAGLKNYLIEIMKKSLNSNKLACYQAAIAVENLGEWIFLEDTSSHDVENNKIQIEIFLNQ
ncbi:MAG: hypothetical protein COA86_07845 [Kangiella sp.]|nr:MAG: hypothetical protein COA86_07845 [Kangiella sp.]